MPELRKGGAYKKRVREIVSDKIDQTYDHIYEHLKETCKSVAEVQQGFLVKSQCDREYWITPYRLWRGKGQRGKGWYYYRTIEDLVANYLNKPAPWDKKEKDESIKSTN